MDCSILEQTSTLLEEILKVAGDTMALIAESFNPGASAETRQQIVLQAERYMQLCHDIRENLIAQLAELSGPAAGGAERPVLDAGLDPSLDARTAELVTREKMAILYDDLLQALGPSSSLNPSS